MAEIRVKMSIRDTFSIDFSNTVICKISSKGNQKKYNFKKSPPPIKISFAKYKNCMCKFMILLFANHSSKTQNNMPKAGSNRDMSFYYKTILG